MEINGIYIETEEEKSWVERNPKYYSIILFVWGIIIVLSITSLFVFGL